MTRPSGADRTTKKSARLLLEEFPPVSTQAWEDLIARDLKGADYEKELVWKTHDGLSIHPYYRAEDVAEPDALRDGSGLRSFLQGGRTTGDWRIREEIYDAEPSKANQAARAALAAGAEEIEFRGVDLGNHSTLDTMLGNLSEASLHFHAPNEAILELLMSRAKPIHGSAGFDPLSNLQLSARILAAPSEPFTLIPFTIDAAAFEEAGGTVVQEIAFTLAAAIDFLSELQSRKLAVDRAAASLAFSFSIGSSYFFQIAKLRAFRLLWARVVEVFGGNAQDANAYIHARTSRWNETIYNPHVNILRATTEAMSAAIGGADSITVAPFDECYKAPSEASRRLARNTQVLLKKESQLARVADPGGGSYYLEVLTDSLAKVAWQTMQQIEADGGFLKCRAAGKIDGELAKSKYEKEQAIASGSTILVGTNKYLNQSERMLSKIENDRMISHPGRAASQIEETRIQNERDAARAGETPQAQEIES